MADEPLKRGRVGDPSEAAQPAQAPAAARNATVLFCDVCDSTRLYDTLGDSEALAIVTRCLQILEEQVYEHRGRIVKTMGDALLCVFPDASTAATGAVAMQQSVEHYGSQSTVPVSIRVGLHSGPVIEERGDVFGDAVNMAARLVGIANGGQIITDGRTLAGMRAAFRRRSRAIDRTTLRGKPEPVEIVELGWRRRSGTPFTTEQGNAVLQAVAPGRLRLLHLGREVLIDSTRAALAIGRDAGNDLAVTSRRVSRRHARIERRRDKFVLQDHSTNGTFVLFEGEAEILVRRETVLLRGNGVIGLGESTRSAVEGLVRFEHL